MSNNIEKEYVCKLKFEIDINVYGEAVSPEKLFEYITDNLQMTLTCEDMIVECTSSKILKAD